MSELQTTLPADFLQRLPLIYSPQEIEQLLTIFSHNRPHTLRANTLKASHQQVFEELSAAGFELEKVPWLPGFVMRNKGLRDLEEQPLYQSGSLYVQGLSSMIPPVILNPQPGESIVDIAAAPGSKTTQMAALMKNEGMILANDTSTVRLYKLAANLQKQDVTCVKTRQGLGELLWRDFPAVFDRALVDVPCGMEGRFNLQKPKTLASWSLKKVKELSQRQLNLLKAAISVTRSGGEIVYSTCTLSPEENEGVIDTLLRKGKESVTVEEIVLPDGLASRPVMEWKGKTYHPDVAKTKRIMPSELYEGFFITKLRKV